MGVWSKRISGVEEHGEQFSKSGGEFFDSICRDEEVDKESATVLHSDNRVPMCYFALAAKMLELGISLSSSKPMPLLNQ